MMCNYWDCAGKSFIWSPKYNQPEARHYQSLRFILTDDGKKVPLLVLVNIVEHWAGRAPDTEVASDSKIAAHLSDTETVSFVKV